MKCTLCGEERQHLYWGAANDAAVCVLCTANAVNMFSADMVMRPVSEEEKRALRNYFREDREQTERLERLRRVWCAACYAGDCTDKSHRGAR